MRGTGPFGPSEGRAIGFRGWVTLCFGPIPLHWQRSFAWGFAAAYNLRFFEADFTFRGGFAFKKDRAGPLKIPAQRFASLRHLHPAASCAGGRKDFANPGSPGA